MEINKQKLAKYVLNCDKLIWALLIGISLYYFYISAVYNTDFSLIKAYLTAAILITYAYVLKPHINYAKKISVGV